MFPGIPILQCNNYSATQNITANTMTPVLWTAPSNFLIFSYGGISLSGLPGTTFTNGNAWDVNLFISAFISSANVFDFTGAGLGICLIDLATGDYQGLNFSYGSNPAGVQNGAFLNLPYTVLAGQSFQIGTIGSAQTNANYTIGSTSAAQQNLLTIFPLS